MDEERLYTVKEVAEHLRLNPETVRVWLRQGRVRGVLMGGRRGGYRIPASELRRLIEGEGKAAACRPGVSVSDGRAVGIVRPAEG